jgi:uracil-DNA glycosylase
MDLKMPTSWMDVLEAEMSQPYFKALLAFLEGESVNKKIFPAESKVFRAFELCPFETVKIVILGQDPYHGDGQANGLAFSLDSASRMTPSLRNIFQELQADLGGELRKEVGLEDWARQGVLLLNATLTVEAHRAGSHQNKGWEEFTSAVVSILSEKKDKLCFVLWGAHAQGKEEHIDAVRHLVLKAPHPSPFSARRGFFGSKPFSRMNDYLVRAGKSPIRWS